MLFVYGLAIVCVTLVALVWVSNDVQIRREIARVDRFEDEDRTFLTVSIGDVYYSAHGTAEAMVLLSEVILRHGDLPRPIKFTKPPLYLPPTFSTEADAEELLKHMKGVVNEFGNVRMVDMFDYVGDLDTPEEFEVWGWLDLSETSVISMNPKYEKPRYIVDLPDPIELGTKE